MFDKLCPSMAQPYLWPKRLSILFGYRRGAAIAWVLFVFVVRALPTNCNAATSELPACNSNCISQLVETYAPLLMHPTDEPNLPTNVLWFLPRSQLSFKNTQCPSDDMNFGVASEMLLKTASRVSACGGHVYRASGTRSASRSKTFILSDVTADDRGGSKDPAEWTTYYHTFKNSLGGYTIQYWTFYAFNTGVVISVGLHIPSINLGSHGGDWEMVEVVLGASLEPVALRMTGHTHIEGVRWSDLQFQDTHPIVYTEKGGHEAHPGPSEPPPWISHPSWRGSAATFPGQQPRSVGLLINLGTRLHPREPFLRHSGLWGSLGATPISSGYWGPAFNETDMRPIGFLSAWCDGISLTEDLAENAKRECYADDVQ
jgi:hypothetical protein